jgi:hypothetical protein
MHDERQEEARQDDLLLAPLGHKTDAHEAGPPAGGPLGYSLEVLDTILDP